MSCSESVTRINGVTTGLRKIAKCLELTERKAIVSRVADEQGSKDANISGQQKGGPSVGWGRRKQTTFSEREKVETIN